VIVCYDITQKFCGVKHLAKHTYYDLLSCLTGPFWGIDHARIRNIRDACVLHSPPHFNFAHVVALNDDEYRDVLCHSLRPIKTPLVQRRHPYVYDKDLPAVVKQAPRPPVFTLSDSASASGTAIGPKPFPTLLDKKETLKANAPMIISKLEWAKNKDPNSLVFQLCAKGTLEEFLGHACELEDNEDKSRQLRELKDRVKRLSYVQAARVLCGVVGKIPENLKERRLDVVALIPVLVEGIRGCVGGF
jgi:hypothetical protein